MESRARKIFIIAIIVFVVGSLAAIIYFLLFPKIPSTQQSNKTVIIDNYTQYTTHISPDSFGNLGNYLYGFINHPTKGVYHGTIVDKSYSYSSDSWFSTFIVKLNDSDVSWKVSMQTDANGDTNSDIGVTCNSGGSACLSVSSTQPTSPPKLQDYLPITTNDYIISIQTDNYNGLSIVYYDQAGTGKTEALDKIKSLGFNPSNYDIQYYYGGND